MRKVAVVFPWAIVAVLSAVVAVQYRSPDARPEGGKVVSSDEETVQPVPRLEDIDSELAERVEALRIENENLRESVSSQAQQIETLEVALSEARQQAVSPRESKPASVAQVSENRRAMTEQFAEMRFERRYGAFLASIGLDPNREEEVRESLRRVLTDASSSPHLTDDEYSARMREELVRVLSPEELAEFDEYQEQLPERLLRQSFGGQVNAMAAGLSEETRAILVDVLVEEALIANQSPPPEDATAGYPLVQRMNVYANTAARFDGVLDETESVAVNRFLNQQHSQLETTVETIERAEAAGATPVVDFQDGLVRVEIEQRE